METQICYSYVHKYTVHIHHSDAAKEANYKYRKDKMDVVLQTLFSNLIYFMKFVQL